MAALSEYEISFTDYDAKDDDHPHGTRVVVGTAKAPSGQDAIKLCLTRHFQRDEDMIQAILGGRRIDRARWFACGITFYARKLHG